MSTLKFLQPVDKPLFQLSGWTCYRSLSCQHTTSKMNAEADGGIKEREEKEIETGRRSNH